MSKPAARISDMHVCPMVTGVVPHVGGPVTGPGVATVLIGGMPAAVQGDMCVCTGPPDTIIMGSTGVLIGGKPAARMGDMTTHGGTIVMGAPTVLIGESGGGGGGGGGGAGASTKKASGNANQAKDVINKKNLSNAAKNGDGLAARSNKEDMQVKYTLIDEAEKGIADTKYEVRCNDGTIFSGKTDGGGATQTITGYTAGECSVTFFDKNK